MSLLSADEPAPLPAAGYDEQLYAAGLADEDAYSLLRGGPSPFAELSGSLCAGLDAEPAGQEPKCRYYVNKLYQPPGRELAAGTPCSPSPPPSTPPPPHSPPSPLVERDQEHLLYQGLKFLEPAGQTKLLLDDERALSQPGEDPLATIIDTFGSFPSSPLVAPGREPAPPEADQDDQLRLDFEQLAPSQPQYLADHYELERELELGPDQACCFDQVSSSYLAAHDGLKRKRADELADQAPAKSSKSCTRPAKRRAPSKRSAGAQADDSAGNSVSSTFSSLKAKIKHLDQAELLLLDEHEASSSSVHAKQPQLSVYRRRTANARERIRMREINQAFEKLKKVVPIEMIQQLTNSGDESDQTSCAGRGKGSPHSDCSQSVKLTKITTLRLAVSYIAKLSEVLNQQPEGNASLPAGDRSSPTTARQSAGSAAARHSAAEEPASSDLKLDSRPRVDGAGDQQAPAASQPALAAPAEVGAHLDGPPAPILLNSVCQGFGPLQQHQQLQQLQHQQQAKQLSYQHQLGAADNRAFVTPVAVAILGIPSAHTSGDSQTIQLLSIPTSHQHRAQPAGSYNLIAPQPQQVTLTLDDMSGLSVLRLANPSAAINVKPVQLQPNRSQLLKQPQTQLMSTTTTAAAAAAATTTTTTTGPRYNLASYQPIQIGQLQTHSQQLVELEPTDALGQAGRTATVNMTAHPITGNNSDCKAISIAPNCQLITAGQLKLQAHQPQPLASSHLLAANQQLMAIAAPNGQLYQSSQQASQGQSGHLIYLSPSPSNLSGGVLGQTPSDPSRQPNNGERVKFIQTVQLEHNGSSECSTNTLTAREANIRKLVANLATSIHHSPADRSAGQAARSQAPFSALKSNSETNGCLKYHHQAGREKQVDQSKSAHSDRQQSPAQGQNQAKKTYRFHNYDGNMISNHLYNNNNSSNNNSNHDKQQLKRVSPQQQQQQLQQLQQHQQHQQQQSQPQPEVVGAHQADAGPRSRQNSLSSTCSTTSSMSSSVASSSPSAASTPSSMLAGVKSNGLG